MQIFDASSIIYAWDNYPLAQFPPLWDWLSSRVEEKTILMSRVASVEVAHKSPDCHGWLRDNGLKLLEVTNEIVQEAMRIKRLLRIVNDSYHPKGVDENDLLIIATARIHCLELVSDESR